jgi:hypothetical protein
VLSVSAAKPATDHIRSRSIALTPPAASAAVPIWRFPNRERMVGNTKLQRVRSRYGVSKELP